MSDDVILTAEQFNTAAARECPLVKPRATDDDWDNYDGGEGEHLCWCESGDLCNQGGSWGALVPKLCDEIDMLRAALANSQRVCGDVSKSADLWHRRWEEEVRRVDALRAEARKGEG